MSSADLTKAPAGAFVFWLITDYNSRMRQSKLFTKTRREAPADEVAKNAKLLVRAGFIHKEMAGVYSYLPLGLRTLNKVVQIIREEMNAIGGQELLLSALQNPELWKKTDRWEQDVWFKTSLTVGGELGLGWTQEEAITRIATEHIRSYRDLPFSVYQIQTKFRNEERAKSGIMRGREFLMKDLYSFHADEKDLNEFYEQATEAYRKVFKQVGIGEKTFITLASGGAFSKYSHEFQTLCDAGEDEIYVSRKKNIAVNKDVLTDEVLADLKLDRGELKKAPAAEVGNIFKLGTRFSDALGLTYLDRKGKSHPVVMGCYGIGPSRIIGVVAEVLADKKGLVWPESVSPFSTHLVSLGKNDEVSEAADALYEDLEKKGSDILYDDRDLRAGEKFADSDLIGIPKRIVVGKEFIQSGLFEVIDRATGKVERVPRAKLLG